MDRANSPLGEIKFLVGPEAGSIFQITKPYISIGRQPGNDIVTIDSTTFLNHAEIVLHNGIWTIHALSPQCKISVNQQEIQHANINNHDVICLGANTIALFLIEDNAQQINTTPPQNQPIAMSLPTSQPSVTINSLPPKSEEKIPPDPLRNPRDPAWQLIGVIITALSVILSIFQLPDSARLAGILTGTSGIAVCFFVLIRLRRITGINTTLQKDKFISSSPSVTKSNLTPQSIQPASSTTSQIEKNKQSQVRQINLTSSLIINLVLCLVFGIIASLFPNSQGIVDLIYVLAFVGMVIIFVVFIVRVFQLILNETLRIRKIFIFCLIALATTITIISISQVISKGEVNGLFTWSIGPLLAGTFALAEEAIVLIVLAISGLIRGVKRH